ncbi:hypothetical protein B0I35DRAFT_164775 [Stachybotrys elegans]|uniref:GPI inositol-deacylase n=1 Tax=Stachybotrys elegans TaxID=80388 RepID=A0A8K0SVR2_9HYPO|nr:hypothetical protein B0I35DRAFT_164775 [Stachybotrys elegans]
MASNHTSQGRIFKLPHRAPNDEPGEGDFDARSNPLSATTTLIHAGNPSRPSRDTPQDDRDDQRRSSFLSRRFSSIWTESATEEGTRGPLGLRLLFASPEPMVEIIFVHGLCGGSVKTWQKGQDPRLFWPQHWLPSEAEFRRANIHSFGYDADWKKSQPSILGIHDFGQALYEEIRSSPALRRNPKSPIVLVGHSMGGLVIKKAHILAHRNRDQCDVSGRIRGIFFLATPHKGSDYAALLNNILKVSGIAGLSSSREYIDGLKVGSKSTQFINDEFGSCIADLTIFSFFETLPTNIGISSTIVVDKESAVLGPGYHNERVTYLNANHPNMCKFCDPNDPNYLTLKNALGSFIEDILEDDMAQNERRSSSDLLAVRSYLGTHDYPENRQDRLKGSCQWIDEREDYKDWRDGTPRCDKSRKYRPSIYWVTANPGAGKTVLVTHVESQLEEFGLENSAYYFNFGKKESRSLAGLLRSIAYQMARSNAAVRETLMKFHDEASTLDLDDARAIWSKIFRTGIFQTSILAAQYWLLDAIDECVAYAEFFTLLRGTPISFPLKVFITSRKLADMPKLVRQLNDIDLNVVEIPIQDTMSDIELYIASRMADLPVENEEQAAELTNQIIAKSNASFLWVRLVMDELEGVYGHESIVEVLRGIPEGMVSYYRRTVTEMAENKRERHIARAILQWVALASRPLSTLEIAYAVSVDVKTQLSSPKPAIEGLCGHLVAIDAESDHVRIIHSTARAFLSSEDAGEFRISTAEAHERIALVCLKLLCGPEMQPPRHRRMLDQKRPAAKAPALLDYAISHFSDHVFSASASSDELLAAVVKFLSSTTLTWIDKVATKGDMHSLVRAARNLKAYSLRRSKYSSPLDRHVVCVDSWATDLGRIAIKFHFALSTYPQSIYFLIPPLCPTNSAIHRQFRRMPDSLTLLGPTDQHWNDCVATLDFGDKTATAVSCGESLIAVAFESGDICFYNTRNQETELVVHEDLAVDLLQFDPQGLFIVGSNRRFLMLWDLQGNLLWKTRVRVRFWLLAFSPTYVLGVAKQGKVLKWDIETGEPIDELALTYEPPEDATVAHSISSRAPCTASISPNQELIALAYRNGPVCLFDLETTGFVCWAPDAKNRCPQYLIFHPNADVNLLLVIYNESHMSLFDPWTGVVVNEYEPEEHIISISATCSPSGNTFATVDIQGTLRIWDFESLAVLYHVLTPNQSFRMLEFTSDNFSLLDVTDHEMKVWSPAALMRKTVEEEASISDQPENIVVPEGQFETLQSSRVRAFAAHTSDPIFFVGKNNGDVAFYSLTDGKEVGVLYTHQDSVGYLASCKGTVIASSDLFNIIQVWTLTIRKPNIVQTNELKLKTRAASSIRQLLLDDSGEFLLVSTTRADIVYRTSDGTMIGSMDWADDERVSWKWVAIPDNGQGPVFALVHDHILSHYTASSFPRSSPVPPIRLDHVTDARLENCRTDAVFFNASTRHLTLQYSQRSSTKTHCSIAIFQLPQAGVSTPPQLSPLQNSLGATPSAFSSFKFSLGFNALDNRFMFLRKDSWVCSIPIDGSNSQYARHFFVPNEYATMNNELLPIQAPGGIFIFCLFDRIVIIKNGLKFHDHVQIKMT